MKGATHYGVDTSDATGHLAWCRCGWRSDLEDDTDRAYDLVVRHRLAEHKESPGIIRRRLGVSA